VSSAEKSASALERLRHKMNARVGEDYANLRCNTALAALMELVNALNKAKDDEPTIVQSSAFAAALDALLLLIAPMAPHIAEELWHQRGHTASIHTQPWPAYDPALTVDELVTVVVQVNGKLRDKLEVAPDTAEDDLRTLALASPKVQAATNGKAVKKFIYVPGRLANIVV
jgi:leucyl-tRNA synthetase